MNHKNKNSHNGINNPALSSESWRVFQIMAEFVEGYDKPRDIQSSVSMFGSARTLPGHDCYKAGEAVAGPGKGAYAGKSKSVGLNIQFPHEQPANPCH